MIDFKRPLGRQSSPELIERNVVTDAVCGRLCLFVPFTFTANPTDDHTTSSTVHHRLIGDTKHRTTPYPYFTIKQSTEFMGSLVGSLFSSSFLTVYSPATNEAHGGEFPSPVPRSLLNVIRLDNNEPANICHATTSSIEIETINLSISRSFGPSFIQLSVEWINI